MFVSKNFSTYPWNIPQTPNQQFMKEFVLSWWFRDSWGMLQGYVGVFLDCSMYMFFVHDMFVSQRSVRSV